MKKLGLTRILELTERRVELLRSLVRVQEEWRGAFVALKFEDSERFAGQESQLCDQITILDIEIKAAQGVTKTAGTPAEDLLAEQQIRAAREQIAALYLELKRSNDTRRAILKRSKLTSNALRNLFNSYAPTYASPVAHRTGTVYEESV